jgi:putative hydrolase of the HAD superfamily
MRKVLFALTTFLVATIALVASPKAVVFDWGGVVAQPDRSIIAGFLCQTFHFSESDLEKATKTGKLDPDFWMDLAKQKGITLPENWANTYLATLKTSLGVNPKMFVLIEELKKEQIQVGLLSNINERYSQLLRSLQLYQAFDPCLLSSEIGIEKPAPQAYEILVQTLHLLPEEIVFIDDNLENVEAAKAKGIDAIIFESPEQVRKELQQRGILSMKT